jgi:SAM-dependent methyltransferase
VVWFHAIAESRHELQNPTSAEKIALVGAAAGLGRESRVLDVASGRGGPALVLAQAFGSRFVCVEKWGGFAAVARERAEAAGLAHLIEVHDADAAEFPLGTGYDAALCLGATWIWDGLAGTAKALAAAVRDGGHVVVGEPYRRGGPLPPETADDGFVSLAETVARFESAGLRLVALVASSEDDWDRYESLHWAALEEWLATNPGHPQHAEIREEHERSRRVHLEYRRELLGWAMLVGWKPGAYPATGSP